MLMQMVLCRFPRDVFFHLTCGKFSIRTFPNLMIVCNYIWNLPRLLRWIKILWRNLHLQLAKQFNCTQREVQNQGGNYIPRPLILKGRPCSVYVSSVCILGNDDFLCRSSLLLQIKCIHNLRFYCLIFEITFVSTVIFC